MIVSSSRQRLKPSGYQSAKSNELDWKTGLILEAQNDKDGFIRQWMAHPINEPHR
jgi:hypothetical protein